MRNFVIPLARRAAVAALAAAIAVSVPAAPAHALGGPPGTPTLLSPPPGWVFPYLAPQLFSLISSDPDGEPYTAVVTIRSATSGAVVTQFVTGAPSAVKASGAPIPPLDAGSYTWSAHASDPTGATSSESAPAAFQVEAPPTVGGGELDAVLTYGSAGVSHGSCAPTTFDFSGRSAAAVINLSLVGFVGPVVVSGGGGSSCENASFGEGAITLNATGTGPTGSSISCPSLDGGYTRVAAVLVVRVDGWCTVNNFTMHAELTISAGYVTTEPGGGVTVPFRRATAAGAFTVVPK